jgi:hypothetical protein
MGMGRRKEVITLCNFYNKKVVFSLKKGKFMEKSIFSVKKAIFGPL